MHIAKLALAIGTIPFVSWVALALYLSQICLREFKVFIALADASATVPYVRRLAVLVKAKTRFSLEGPVLADWAGLWNN